MTRPSLDQSRAGRRRSALPLGAESTVTVHLLARRPEPTRFADWLARPQKPARRTCAPRDVRRAIPGLEDAVEAFVHDDLEDVDGGSLWPVLGWRHLVQRRVCALHRFFRLAERDTERCSSCAVDEVHEAAYRLRERPYLLWCVRGQVA
jgi:hypothetical protein